MRIIKEGIIPNVESVFICNYCKCEFAVTPAELRDSPYINKESFKCPTCGTQVYGFVVREVEENESDDTEETVES